MKVKTMKLIKEGLIFLIISLVFLEIGIRTLVEFDLVPARLIVGSSDVLNLEDIYFDGKVLPNSPMKGAFHRYKPVNSYTGYFDDFDYGIEALRVLTMGSSYTAGWSPDRDTSIYADIAARNLADGLGKNVQFADSSANGLGNLDNTYIVYGNKILTNGVAHDIALVELALSNFNPYRSRVETVDAYTPSSANENFANKIVRNLFSVRFILLHLKTMTNLLVKFGLYPAEDRSQDSPEDQQGKRTFSAKLYAAYWEDRPSFDLNTLRGLGNDEKKAALEVATKALDFNRVFNSLSQRKRVTLQNKSAIVVLLFPEFNRDEMIALVDQLDKLDLPVIYLDELRNYTDTTIWTALHPNTLKGQKILGDSVAKGLLPIMRQMTPN